MPENASGPRLDFNNPKAAGILLLLGAPLLRLLALLEGIDFILSIREEKIAMALQLFLDWDWLILMVAAIVWILSVPKSPVDSTKVHWGMVATVGILAFMAGTLITVHAVGLTPMVLLGWGGDAIEKTCSASIDTSRLVGRQDKDRIILICGAADPTHDAIEDERIAVSQPFTITGQATNIVAPYGAMADAVKQLENRASQMPKVPNQNPGFMLWHAVALIPKDINVSEIKRASDVAKRGGKIVTEPQVGAWGSVQAIIPITPPPSATTEQKKP